MKKQQTLSFVACPNSDHVGKEGWEARQLYYAGNGIFKCSSCGKEFTRDEVQNEVQKDFDIKLMELREWYQQSLATLYEVKQENLEEFNKLLDE